MPRPPFILIEPRPLYVTPPSVTAYIYIYPILGIFYCSILLYSGRVISAHISLVDIFLCTAHAWNNEIDWEGTGGRSLLLVLGLEFWAIRLAEGALRYWTIKLAIFETP